MLFTSLEDIVDLITKINHIESFIRLSYMFVSLKIIMYADQQRFSVFLLSPNSSFR